MLDAEERRAVEAMLRRFAGRIEAELFAGEGADGDLGRVPRLLTEARALDLVADPSPQAPGHVLGVWGSHCHEEGLGVSLLTLALLAEACAGFAAAVHAQGLACLALPASAGWEGDAPAQSLPLEPGILLGAAFTPYYGIPLSTRFGQEGTGLHLVEEGGQLFLSGSSHFLLAAGPPRALVCFARGPGLFAEDPPGWVSLVVDLGAAGLDLQEVGQRTGLRAAYQAHLRCERVAISGDQILQTGEATRRTLAQVLGCDWLGQAAIALGVARRALRDSRAYAADRYQGGRLIEGHAAVQLLQGTAEYDVAVLESLLDRHAAQPLASMQPRDLLEWACAARLAVGEHACRAVSNCLQTLGGYGYMEDYGLEKRLRDVSTLRGLHGAPDQLRLYLNQLRRGTGVEDAW
jgi:alkylation response protein AidB-like acyl-CoA dehydrogenase